MIKGIRLYEVSPNRRKKDQFGAKDKGSWPSIIAHGLEKHLLKANAQAVHDLAVALHNKVALARPINERQKTLFGRLINKLSATDVAGYIEITGIELTAIGRLIDEALDTTVMPGDAYLLPFDEAERILRLVNKQAEQLK